MGVDQLEARIHLPGSWYYYSPAVMEVPGQSRASLAGSLFISTWTCSHLAPLPLPQSTEAGDPGPRGGGKGGTWD